MYVRRGKLSLSSRSYNGPGRDVLKQDLGRTDRDVGLQPQVPCPLPQLTSSVADQALCPLVATDSAAVPLDDGLAKDFASMLKDVSPEQLQLQWAGLAAVENLLSAGIEPPAHGRLPLLVMTGDHAL